jgi:hypothetical protein
MTSPLENLCGPGKPLAKEPPDAREFAGLRRSALARLKDARNPANSLESRFDRCLRQGGHQAGRIEVTAALRERIPS